MKTQIFNSILKFAVIGMIISGLLSCSIIVAQNNQPYLGQTPPGMTVKRFPPDSLLANQSWMWHGSPVFSADGLEMFWTEYSEPTPTSWNLRMFTMIVENNNWSAIRTPSFCDTNYRENNPVFSVNGDTLFYYSARPNSFINMVVKTSQGWSQPEMLNIPMGPHLLPRNTFSLNKNKDIYLDLFDSTTNKADLYVSRFQNGVYQLAQNLGTSINSLNYNEMTPYVDPDENYLIFGSNRPGGYGSWIDLYICFKNSNQQWSDPVNMGYKINATNAFNPNVTLDRKYLFFNSAKPNDIGYNPYWISADVIDSLKSLGISKPEIQTGNIILFQNSPNPFSTNTTFFFELISPAEISITIKDLFGKKHFDLIQNITYPSGKHTINFDASFLSDGFYFYVIKSKNSNSIIRKMIKIS
jgi:hypothetical protein